MMADFDLDGYVEFAVSQGQTSVIGRNNILRIYRGTPDGPKPGVCADIPANNGLRNLNAADFNRDSYLDLFVTCHVDANTPENRAKAAGIYYGSKDGFSSSNYEGIEALAPAGSIADVNNDGYIDLLFADKRKYVLIYFGSKDGFSKERTQELACPGLEYAGTVNPADLNKDGWIDLITGTMGHYHRREDTLTIFYGSPDGYSLDNTQKYFGNYSPIGTAIADYNKDGNLDVLVTGYSSATARVIPAKIFWGNGKTIDLENPLELFAEGSCEAIQVDFNGDSWVDLFLACHRNDLGHQVNSLIYWNGPDGFSRDRTSAFPGLGPHGTNIRDYGNAFTREPAESYISPAFDMDGKTVKSIHWDADVPSPSKLKFQLRCAKTKEQLENAEWTGPGGKGTYFEKSGKKVKLSAKNARWIQYKALFISPYGCRSPKLREVRLDLK